MLSGFIEQEILEGKIWYFGLYTDLNGQETIDLQAGYESAVRQKRVRQQVSKQRQNHAEESTRSH